MILRRLAKRRRKGPSLWQITALTVSVLFFAVGAYQPEVAAWLAFRPGLAPLPVPPALPPPDTFPRMGTATRHERNPHADEYVAKFKPEYEKQFGGLAGQATASVEADNDLNLTITVYHKAVELTTADQRATLLQAAAKLWAQYAPGSQVSMKDLQSGGTIGSMKAEGETKVVNPPDPKEPSKPGK